MTTPGPWPRGRAAAGGPRRGTTILPPLCSSKDRGLLSLEKVVGVISTPEKDGCQAFSGAGLGEKAVDHQEEQRPADGDGHAPEVESRDVAEAQLGGDEAADDGAQDAQDDGRDDP